MLTPPSFSNATLRFPSETFGYDFAGVAKLAAGDSIAIAVPAHKQPAPPRQVSVEIRCQPRGAFEQNPNDRFHYGGSATYEIRNDG
jgi:hypothetical protein